MGPTSSKRMKLFIPTSYEKHQHNNITTCKNQQKPVKNQQKPWKTNKNQWKTNKNHEKPVKNQQKPWKTNKNQWKTNKNHEKTVKNQHIGPSCFYTTTTTNRLAQRCLCTAHHRAHGGRHREQLEPQVESFKNILRLYVKKKKKCLKKTNMILVI